MAQLLTDKIVEALQPPPKDGKKPYLITYDSEVRRFGVRVTKAGAKSFVIRYRAKNGTEPTFTLGSFPDWKVSAAREYAKAFKRRVDMGEDPQADRTAYRAAPTMDALADRFEAEHLVKRRPATQRDYKSILNLYIRPELGKIKVAELRHADGERLHAKIATSAPYRANRTKAVLHTMMELAVKWEMRHDNPIRGIEMAPEHKRERFLSAGEIARLVDALAAVKEKNSADAVRLLMLTGARKSEVLKARWTEFDLEAGVWRKPSAHTKSKRDHRIPLSAPALLLLTEMRAAADKLGKTSGKEAVFLFPSDKEGQPLADVKKTWATVCQKAGLGTMVPKLGAGGKPVRDAQGKPVMIWQGDTRMHDLRHTYASILASHGLSLPIIGALLGHTQAQTTQRYAHLLDDPLRKATEQVGRVVSGEKKVEASAC